MTTVYLGCCDSGVSVEWRTWLRDWNPPLGKRSFRDEPLGKWRAPKTLSGTPVAELQQQLKSLGFMPFGPVDGICGYRTRAAIRLFQEHVRGLDGDDSIGAVDGIAGSRVREHLDRWSSKGLIANWSDPGGDYHRALGGLIGLKRHFHGEGADTDGIALLNKGPRSGVTSSRPVAEWDFSTDAVHLIGIRRNVNQVRVRGTRHHRALDDVFVLLVGGTRWVFLGSTDPVIGDRTRKPFILRGQHAYSMQWHNITDSEKVYRAFKPKDDGVLIVRSRDNDGRLEEADYAVSHAEVNNTINIHWSGIGTSNWSAGCQVIAGAKYLGPRGELVDCSERAARNYDALSGKRTKAAYNVLCDLITVFSPDATQDGDGLLYTLLFEDDLQLGFPLVVDPEAMVQAMAV